MKALSIIGFITAVLMGLMVSAPLKLDQPTDNNVRLAEVVRIIDGDSIVMDVHLGDGVWIKNRHIRLKDVHCFEVDTEQGVKEREYLRGILGNPKAPLAIQMFGKDKYGRLLASVWCDNKSINSLMQQQPQGGR